MRVGVVLFHTIHDLFVLEKALRQRGLEVKPIPTPRELSSDCGSALRFEFGARDVVQAAIDALGLETQGIHELDAGG